MTSKKLTPVKSIKSYCRYQCCANDVISWKECPASNCPLFPYRLGKRPKNTQSIESCDKKPIVLHSKFAKKGI